MRNIIMLMLILILSVTSCQQVKESELLVINEQYFGQTIPDKKLEIFAPGIVSTGLNEGYITFSPDGKECYWSILFSDIVTIAASKLEKGNWTKPEIAPFAGKYYDGWPAIAVLTDSLNRKYSLQELIDRDIKSPSLGSTDIYRIDAKIIEDLRLNDQ